MSRQEKVIYALGFFDGVHKGHQAASFWTAFVGSSIMPAATASATITTPTKNFIFISRPCE